MRNSMPLASYSLPLRTKKPLPVLYAGRATGPGYVSEVSLVVAIPVELCCKVELTDMDAAAAAAGELDVEVLAAELLASAAVSEWGKGKSQPARRLSVTAAKQSRLIVKFGPHVPFIPNVPESRCQEELANNGGQRMIAFFTHHPPATPLSHPCETGS